MTVLWLFMIFITFIICVFAAWYHLEGWKRKYPHTLESYLHKYPNSKTSHGISCAHCNSKSLRNLGSENATSSRRLVSCNSCSSTLYHAIV